MTSTNSGRPTIGAYDWLIQFGLSLKEKSGVSVPCEDCNACCRAGYAVRTNDGKLYLPKSDGSCSELQNGKCSVYACRPRTCQYYDCRTHLFSGVDPEKPVISKALKKWQIPRQSEKDKAVVRIIQAAAATLSEDALLPEDIAVQSCLLAYERIKAG